VEITEPFPETAEARKSYTTTLVIADGDSVLPFHYHRAWGRALRAMPFQVEVSWRYKLMTSEAWKKLAKRRIGLIKDEAEDRGGAG
ncbi:hypothetical protein, partial [Salmonella enterica]